MTRPNLLTVAEVAELTRLATSTLCDWAKKGKGPKSYKLGRRRVYDEADVLAWIKTHREDAA